MENLTALQDTQPSQTRRSLHWVLDKLGRCVLEAFRETLWLMNLPLWVFWKINSKER